MTKENKYSLPKSYSPKVRRWPSNQLASSPAWCSVDLRDGNQALPNPMEPFQKQLYLKLLLDIGFKEIEIGFPAASTEEKTFCRDIIEQKLIPDDVTVSVLSQCREHIITRTMEALRGVHNAIFHIYLPTSELHAKYVLGESQRQLMEHAVKSVRLIRKLSSQMKDSKIRLEFSPEEFTDSDLPFVSDLCNNVIDAWEPDCDEKVILNLPQTVERALPTHYPDMIETFIEMSKYKNNQIISLHSHNDMGSAVASTELALMAGAQRIEGTLFGNGERSGNLDLVTVALNLEYLGIETGLDFSNLEEIAKQVTKLTSMPISPRHPYAGELVFTAFSGSHQDAINKGLSKISTLKQHFHGWKVPYLHINPQEIGRDFKDTIRINSQSGRGGIAYVLANTYGVQLPQELLDELAEKVQKRTEIIARELRPDEIWDVLLSTFCRLETPLCLINYWPRPDVNDPSSINAEVHLEMLGRSFNLQANGNGPVAAFANALRKLNIPQFKLVNYEERSIGTTVNADSITIVSMERLSDNKIFFGIGFGANIVQGAAKAIISALNRMM